MTKPVILLDIDGVINATSMKIPTHIYPATSWIRVHVDGFQITAARPVVDFLNRINREDLAEIRWHTTWQDRAPDVAEALGLDDFLVQPTDEWPDSSARTAERILAGFPRWWKYPAAYFLLKEGRKVVWIDDDIWSELPAVYRQGLKKHGIIRMVSPERIWGLQPGHMREIERHLKGWSR